MRSKVDFDDGERQTRRSRQQASAVLRLTLENMTELTNQVSAIAAGDSRAGLLPSLAGALLPQLRAVRLQMIDSYLPLVTPVGKARVS